MSFAKLSIQEIQKLHANKVSALQMLVYSVIASHIHSNKRNNAYPSLRRIQALLGGAKPTSIQSITRAITALVTKGLVEKGKVRSRKRFVLIHRPIKHTINSILKATKHFVARYTPSKIMGAVNKISTYPDHSETLRVRQHKRTNQVENSKLFIKRGRSLWNKVCPTGRSDKFDISNISAIETTQLINWIYESEQEWIKDTWPEEVSRLKNEVVYG
tara:strand:- start:342 stop:989 length:648 start_codon:yes stop_codon:yes gene_type:complete